MKLSYPINDGSAATYSSIAIAKSRAFTATNYHEPRFRFMWHYHPEWELTWSSHGRGQRYVGCSIEPFGPGDLVLLAGNLPHTWVSDADSNEEARCSVIQFLPKMFGDPFWNLPEVRSLHRLCERAVRGIRFVGPGVDDVGCRMRELANDDPCDLTSLSRLFGIFDMLLGLKSVSLDADLDPGKAGHANPRLQRLLDWIEQRSAGPLTQMEAAAFVKMSPSTFSRWFKSSMGCVFPRYLNELRIARVCALLTDRNVTVTDAAFRCGFNNLSNFNRRFHEITGLTPRRFRKQLAAHEGGD